MKTVVANAIYQPNPTRIEAKQEATTKAVQELLQRERNLISEKSPDRTRDNRRSEPLTITSEITVYEETGDDGALALEVNTERR